MLHIRLILTLIFIALFTHSHAQNTIVVDPSGNGDYVTIQGAFNTINNSTISQKTRIRIKAGTYDEHLVLDGIQGTSAVKPVIIESFSGDTADVILYHDSVDIFPPRSSLELKNVKHILIQNLSFRSPKNEGYIVGIDEGVGEIEFKGNHFFKGSGTHAKPAISLNYNFNASDYDLGNLYLRNNSCSDINLFSRDISLFNINKLELTNNSVTYVSFSNSTPILQASIVEIKNNTFQNSSIGSITNSDKVFITGNHCHTDDYAILISSLTKGDTAALIANNMISTKRGIGIQISMGKVDVFNNNFYNYDTLSQSISIYLGSFDSVRIVNNNISGLGSKAIGLFMVDTVIPTSFYCDYNNYYFPNGSYTLNNNTFPSRSTTTIGENKSIYNIDSNSLDINPFFVSDTDLHIRNGILKGKGKHLTEVLVDIDGDTRDPNKPTIGADVITKSVDLIPNSFKGFVGQFYPGRTMEIEYDVSNSGDFDLTSLTWFDAIYLSSDQSLDNNDVLLETVTNNFSVDASDLYSRKRSVSIPYISGGTYYFILQTNSTKITFEDTTNNILVSSAKVLPVPQLPDLKVTSVTVPSSIYSGKQFSLNWTVKNTGNASTTGSWSDYVYLATGSSILSQNNQSIKDSLLKIKVSAPTGLKPGQSYNSSTTLSIPIKFSGNVYYRVQTNGNLNIFEQDTTFADNGRISSALNVIQSPLPDLTITDLNIQSSAFSGDTVSANWTVKNVGKQKTYRTDRFYQPTPFANNPRMWHDRLIISRNPYYDPDDKENKQKAFYSRRANDELDVDSSYTVNTSVIFNRCEYGKYYVFAVTNYTASTFELRYNNNVVFIDSIELILQPNPDLKPTAISVTNNPASGKTIDINYTVKNDGFDDWKGNSFRNRFYIHPTSTYEPSQAQFLGRTYVNDSLLKGDEFTETITFNVPYRVYGNQYVSIFTDEDDKVCEEPNEDNNILSSSLVDVDLSKQPDLILTVDDIPDTLIPGQNLQIIIATKNQGQEAANETYWYNTIHLVKGYQIELKKYRISESLAASGTRYDTLNLTIPLDLEEGNYILQLSADFTDRIFEYGGENNNVLTSSLIAVVRDDDRVPDLDVVGLKVIDNAPRAGDEISLEVRILNRSLTTSQTGWKDLILLEDAEGNYFAPNFLNHLGRISKNQIITDTVKVQLPFDKSGEINFHFTANRKNRPIEYNRENNTRSTTQNVLAHIPPDLEPSKITSQLCCNVYAFQHDTLSIEVDNNGPGDVPGRGYFAKVYLSDDQILDKYDHLLATQQHFSGVRANSTETLKVPVKYPYTLAGNLFYIVVIDTDNDIYEGEYEDNNKYTSGYSINLSNKMTDLSLDSISISGYSGANDRWVHINYKFSKPTGDSVYRNWNNYILLSEDKKSLPYAVGTSPHIYAANLPGNMDTFVETKLASMPRNLKPGYYFIGMLLDRKNEIYESDESNNLLFSSDSFYFDFSVPLKLDVKKDTFWYEGRFATSLYYNVERPQDKGMIINLDVSDKNASTEMYQSAGSIPSTTDYDNKYNNPFLADQEILVPVTDTAVKDYIYVIPKYVPPVHDIWDNIDPVPYSIIANSAEFSIHSIEPNTGSIYGNTTVTVRGFDFNNDTKFVLLNSGNDTIRPFAENILNSSEAVLTFDFRDENLGFYDVIALKTGSKASLDNGFEVDTLGFEDPWVNVDMPHLHLTRKPAILNINFGNHANTNGYDYWLVVAMSNTKQNVDHLETSYIGSSEEELNELYGFEGNPTGDSTHIDIDGIRYFVYWIPQLSAKSQTTFTYTIKHTEEDTTLVYALLFPQPLSAYSLSGRFEDYWQSATMYELNQAYHDNIGRRSSNFDCNRIDIKNVQKELAKQTVEHAKNIRGGVSTYGEASGPRSAINITIKEYKNDVLSITDSKTQQEMFKDVVLKKKTVTETFTDYLKKIDPRDNATERFYKKEPPFGDLVKNVFSCLDSDPDLRKDIDRCLEFTSHPKYGKKFRNRCAKKKKDNEDNFVTRWVKSIDPNEIEGPEGVTDLRYVEPDEDMNYIIRFENKPEASAPAVKVSINNPLDSSFSLQSFALKEIGFGDTVILLNDENSLNKVYDLGPKYNNQQLHVVAGLDVINGRAIWRLTTINPITGNPVDDPFGGFLPPNDSTGIGEGYVRYEIKMVAGVEAGTEVLNAADIIFDQNEIIPTNIWSNIITGSDPSSHVKSLPSTSTNKFTVSWTGTDGNLGPGIHSYSIYVSKDNEAYEEWIDNSTDTSAEFTGENGSTYRFYSVVNLMNGVSESIPLTHDAITEIVSTGIEPMIEENNLIIYPNPGQNVIHVRQKYAKDLQITIRSVHGQVLAVQQCSSIENQVEVHHLPAGLYIIQLNQGKERHNFRWLKVK
jgi:hypothetical protein